MKRSMFVAISFVVGWATAAMGVGAGQQFVRDGRRITEVSEIRIVGRSGNIIGRLGESESGGGGLWLYSSGGGERVSLSVHGDPEHPESVSSRFAMLDRNESEAIVLLHQDQQHHGDFRQLQIGEITLDSSPLASSLRIEGMHGRVVLENTLSGPSLRLRAEPDPLHDLPGGLVFIGRQALKDYPDSPLLFRLASGGKGAGSIMMILDKNGLATLVVENAGRPPAVVGG